MFELAAEWNIFSFEAYNCICTEPRLCFRSRHDLWVPGWGQHVASFLRVSEHRDSPTCGRRL